MRILPEEEHHERKEKILQAVVHLYIKTGTPVGSSTIVEKYDLNLSPASIRNVLAELERDDFLTHPHTSAGRMPTDKGYRFYVNSIANLQNLAVEEERHIQDEYNRRMREIEDFMLSTTRVLSELSRCTGFALTSTMETEKIRRIELIPVSQTQILCVLVSESGLVRNHMIMVSRVPDEEALRLANRFLNERLSGLSFPEAQSRLVSENERFNAQHLVNREFLELLAQHLFDRATKTDLYVDGTSNILKFPEFHDYHIMRNFAELVDEREALGKLLTRELSQPGIQVKIGAEASPELKDFSVVSSGYTIHGRPVGILGILGPKRMEYGRMMAIVNAVASLVNKYIEKNALPLLEESSTYEQRRD
ncbi:MAG: heat-inducible transcriptional repressor HrcA [Elusimicrobia bacterium]|nr:heat-inducible transcriptional repressor HrcA [Candidatus Obscuribacterium magneticum]